MVDDTDVNTAAADYGGARNECDDVDARLGDELASLRISEEDEDVPGGTGYVEEDEEPTKLEVLASKLTSNCFKNIVILSGAGVSVSAGIPDFRTPGTGLYDNLQKYNLPYPEAVFDIDFYKRNPRPFLTLAKELWPRPAADGGKITPTLTHCFIKLLEDKGMLRRCFTQNIDGLEVLAGVSATRVMECHGHFRTASCTRCHASFDGIKCRDIILNTGNEKSKGKAPRCEREKCNGIVKPDIVFFGEGLPSEFFSLLKGGDMDDCDLLIVMGTSLQVFPVAAIPEHINNECTRLLVNRELVGTFDENNPRDIYLAGDCDDSIRKLCQMTGWEQDLYKIYNAIPKTGKDVKSH
mmetsp:Transcript_10876/g.14224  ORF Transcript_10876/g.14224 Transcript_10876/m.14224 type:complete len:352 (+) Transcript_10876:248-1303(+)